MKNALILVLSLGIMGSPLLSQESATAFDSGGFVNMPNQPGLWSRPWVQATTGKEDYSVPEENNTERDRIRRNRLISGLCLAGSYVATVVGDFLYEDGYRRYTLIPVIGPFLTMAAIEHDRAGYWAGAKELLILSGIAQTVFATYFVISLTKKPRPAENKALTIWPSLTSFNLRIQF